MKLNELVDRSEQLMNTLAPQFQEGNEAFTALCRLLEEEVKPVLLESKSRLDECMSFHTPMRRDKATASDQSASILMTIPPPPPQQVDIDIPLQEIDPEPEEFDSEEVLEAESTIQFNIQERDFVRERSAEKLTTEKIVDSVRTEFDRWRHVRDEDILLKISNVLADNELADNELEDEEDILESSEHLDEQDLDHVNDETSQSDNHEDLENDDDGDTSENLDTSQQVFGEDLCNMNGKDSRPSKRHHGI